MHTPNHPSMRKGKVTPRSYMFGGETVPTILQQPVKGLGRMYSILLTDRYQLREAGTAYGVWRIDKCCLPGKYKAWCYQFGLLPQLLIAIAGVWYSTIIHWANGAESERKVTKMARCSLGFGAGRWGSEWGGGLFSKSHISVCSFQMQTESEQIRQVLPGAYRPTRKIAARSGLVPSTDWVVQPDLGGFVFPLTLWQQRNAQTR